MHILLIEDDREAAGNIAKGLGETGHRVEIAEDGPDGLFAAQKAISTP